jgi:uncharacterized membrane protein
MNWIVYALLSTIPMAAADFFMKLAAGKLSSSLGLLMYGTSTFTVGLGWVLWQRINHVPQYAQSSGVVSAMMVGVSFCFVVAAFYATFEARAPISIVVPIIRLGGLLIASAAGIVLLREPLTLRYVIGMLMSCAGVYLIVTR